VHTGPESKDQSASAPPAIADARPLRYRCGRMRAVLAVVVVLLASAPAGAQFLNICGDADHDAHITSGDAVIALRASAQLGNACPLRVCDVNADERLSVTDAVNILRNAASLPAIVACSGVDSEN
jgi:hypothetical protein